MDGQELREHCGLAATVAVARMIHRRDPARMHEHFEVGGCPFCTPLHNAAARSGILERIAQVTGSPTARSASER